MEEDKLDTVYISQFFGITVTNCKRYIDRTYGEEKRQEFLKDISNKKYAWNVKCDKSIINTFDEYNNESFLFFDSKEDAEFMRNIIVKSIVFDIMNYEKSDDKKKFINEYRDTKEFRFVLFAFIQLCDSMKEIQKLDKKSVASVCNNFIIVSDAVIDNECNTILSNKQVEYICREYLPTMPTPNQVKEIVELYNDKHSIKYAIINSSYYKEVITEEEKKDNT